MKKLTFCSVVLALFASSVTAESLPLFVVVDANNKIIYCDEDALGEARAGLMEQGTKRGDVSTDPAYLPYVTKLATLTKKLKKESASRRPNTTKVRTYKFKIRSLKKLDRVETPICKQQKPEEIQPTTTTTTTILATTTTTVAPTTIAPTTTITTTTRTTTTQPGLTSTTRTTTTMTTTTVAASNWNGNDTTPSFAATLGIPSGTIGNRVRGQALFQSGPQSGGTTGFAMCQLCHTGPDASAISTNQKTLTTYSGHYSGLKRRFETKKSSMSATNNLTVQEYADIVAYLYKNQ